MLEDLAGGKGAASIPPARDAYGGAQAISASKRRTRSGMQSIALTAAVTTAITLALMQIEAPAMGSGRRYDSPSWAVSIHLATVVPALLLGLLVIMRRKGGAVHRRLGATWMALMVTTAAVSFWIRGDNNAFSGIHLFSVGTLIAVPMAIWRARIRDIEAHRKIMVSLYVGLVVAGVFALDPSRAAGQYVLRLLLGD